MMIELGKSAKRLLDDALATGAYGSAPEVIEAALRGLAAERERQETIRAVREAVAAAEAGQTRSVEDMFDQLDEQFPNLRASEDESLAALRESVAEMETGETIAAQEAFEKHRR